MNKRILSNVTSIMCILFVIWTIVMLFSAYNNINNTFVVKIAKGYVFFLFIFIAYMGLSLILRIRNLKWTELRKRLIRFFTVFIGFLGINILFTYLIKNEVNILNHVYTPLGLALGMTFFDLLGKDINR